MSREKTMRRFVVRALRPLDARPIENGASTGDPDVEFIGGNMELKSLDAWPKRQRTNLRIPHFTGGQRAWLRRRAHRGGLVLVMIKVADDWILMDGSYAAMFLGERTKEGLLGSCWYHWPAKPSEAALITAVRTLVVMHEQGRHDARGTSHEEREAVRGANETAGVAGGRRV